MKYLLANPKQEMRDSRPLGDGKATCGDNQDALKYLNKFS